MRVLITGAGRAGSWKIRGEQLGQAIGASVVPNATAADIAKADVVVVVKRLTRAISQRVRDARKVLVFDTVDFWPQPVGNRWGREQAVAWLRSELRILRPDAVVFATQQMQEDAAFAGPSIALPHHARPGQPANPIRVWVNTVAYEGRECYLGSWRPKLEAECTRRGWRFVVNPKHLADADIVVALRGECWDGYACRAWKSNIKLANAQGTGTPIICLPESGYAETSVGGEALVENHAELIQALDMLTPHDARRHRAALLLNHDVDLDAIAGRYRAWLSSIATS